MITSLSNKKVRNVSALLAKSKERKKQGLFVVEGPKMFAEAPTDQIVEVYLSETYEKNLRAAASTSATQSQRVATAQPQHGAAARPQSQHAAAASATAQPQADDKLSADIRKKLTILRNRSIFVETLPDDLFRRVSDTKTPQGILCVVRMPKYTLEDAVAKITNASKVGENPGEAPDGKKSAAPKALFLLLESIQDPGNLGTMIRSGEGAGVTGIILSADTVDLYNPKTIRATMGSIYRVPVCVVEDLHAAMERLKAKGVTLYAAHLEGKCAYDQADYTAPTAFLIGNEGNGLRPETTAKADTLIRIPMCGEVESLNAAIAGTLLVYEAARQRRK